MNLTSKKLLRFVALAASLCVVSTYADDPAPIVYVADSFEVGDTSEGGTGGGADGKGILEFKAHEFGADKPAWTFATGDANDTKIVAEDNSDFIAKSRPMDAFTTPPLKDLVLKLETDGNLLSRSVGDNPISIGGTGSVWIDTLIKFTPSEEDPEVNDNAVKIAVFVNADNMLSIYHNAFDEEYTETIGITVTDVEVNPDNWYRLTIEVLGAEALVGKPAFKVMLNGGVVKSENALDVLGVPGTSEGVWFVSAASALTANLSAVAFNGTGYIDELVVTDTEVDFGAHLSTALTLSFDEDFISVMVGESTLVTGDTVASGAVLVIETIPFYEIAGITVDPEGGDVNISYANDIGPGAQIGGVDATVTFTEAAAATITAQKWTGSVSLGSATVDAGKVATWALANEVGLGDLDGDALDDYLFNVALGTNPGLEILSIEMVDDEATIVVGAIIDEESDAVVDFDEINGVLTVKVSADLVNWTTALVEEISIGDLGETATITVDLAEFQATVIKAVIE